MPLFKYEALDGKKRIRGEIDAPNKGAAINILKTRGLIVIRIYSPKSQSKISLSSLIGRSRIKLGDREIAVLSRQLGSLLLAGITLVDALATLAEEYKGSKLGRVLSDLYTYIVDMNMRFSAALRKTGSFPVIFINLARVAEETGTLDNTLVTLATFYERRADIKEKIKSAMIYPVMVAFMSVVAILVFLLIVVPKLKAVYVGFGKELPGITQAVINVSDFISRNWLLLILIFLSLSLFLRILLKQSYKLRYWWHSTLLKIPLIGSVLLLGEVVQVFRAFYTLFSGGVPIVQAMELSTEVITNEKIRKIFIEAQQQLERGISLSKALESSDLPGILKVMIKVGEEAGNLDNMIKTYIDMAEKELNIKTDRMIAAIEPLSTIIVGTIVLVILLAMYLPIFSMTSIVRGR